MPTANIEIEINQKNIPLIVKLVKGYVEEGDIGSYLDLLQALKEASPETVGIITTNQDIKTIAKAIFNDGDYWFFKILLGTISGHDHLFTLINKQIKKYLKHVEEEYGASDLIRMISILPPNMVEDYFDNDKLEDILLDFATDDLDIERSAFARFLDNPEDGFKLVSYILAREFPENILTFEIVKKITSKILEKELSPEFFHKSRSLPLYTQWIEVLSQAPEHLQIAVSRATATILETKIPEYIVGLTRRLESILKDYPFALNANDCSEMCRNILNAESESSSDSGFSSPVTQVILNFYHLPQFEEAVPYWVRDYAEAFMTKNVAYPHLPQNLSEPAKAMLGDAVTKTLKSFMDENRPDKIATLFASFPNPRQFFAWDKVNLREIVQDDLGLDMATVRMTTQRVNEMGSESKSLYVLFNQNSGEISCVTLGSKHLIEPDFSIEDFRTAFATTTGLSDWATKMVGQVEPKIFRAPA